MLQTHTQTGSGGGLSCNTCADNNAGLVQVHAERWPQPFRITISIAIISVILMIVIRMVILMEMVDDSLFDHLDQGDKND